MAIFGGILLVRYRDTQQQNAAANGGALLLSRSPLWREREGDETPELRPGAVSEAPEDYQPFHDASSSKSASSGGGGGSGSGKKKKKKGGAGAGGKSGDGHSSSAAGKGAGSSRADGAGMQAAGADGSSSSASNGASGTGATATDESHLAAALRPASSGGSDARRRERTVDADGAVLIGRLRVGPGIIGRRRYFCLLCCLLF